MFWDSDANRTQIFFKKQRYVEVCGTMLYDYQDKMKSIISGDKTWIYAYDQVTIGQLREYRAKNEEEEKN